VAERLTARRLSVAVVESAAGGLIAAELTRLAGSSAYFKGGVVAYDHASKSRLLGIPGELFLEYGSVSAEACFAMAQAARRLFDADIGLGETGVAGPGGDSGAKPMGLSYVAVSSGQGKEVRQHQFAGDREQNRWAAVEAALQLLLELLG